MEANIRQIYTSETVLILIIQNSVSRVDSMMMDEVPTNKKDYLIAASRCLLQSRLDCGDQLFLCHILVSEGIQYILVNSVFRHDMVNSDGVLLPLPP